MSVELRRLLDQPAVRRWTLHEQVGLFWKRVRWVVGAFIRWFQADVLRHSTMENVSMLQELVNGVPYDYVLQVGCYSIPLHLRSIVLAYLL
jgi:hypothetical protein